MFEPLLLLSPYEDAGCEGWISTFAAPIILVGVIGYGLVHWWMNTRVRGYYGALVRKQARDEARFGPAVNIDEKLALDGDVELPSETRSQPSSPTTSKAKPALALYLGRASLSDILPVSDQAREIRALLTKRLSLLLLSQVPIFCTSPFPPPTRYTARLSATPTNSSWSEAMSRSV